jgi:hypothetical protein
MKCEIREECTREIQSALESNLEALQEHIAEQDKSMNDLNENTDKQVKIFGDVMQKHLWEFEAKKNRFFEFDGARSFLFWVGQVLSVLSFFLLLYFVFGGGK